MTPDEALAIVRHAFRREAWREVNQRWVIEYQVMRIWRPHQETLLGKFWAYRLMGYQIEPMFRAEVSTVNTPADRIAFLGAKSA